MWKYSKKNGKTRLLGVPTIADRVAQMVVRSYTFRRRYVQNKQGEFFNGFTPAVSKTSGQELRDRIHNIRMKNKTVS